MIGTISNLFPLSIYRVKGGLTEEVRTSLVEAIDSCIEDTDADVDGVWTGDVKGHHSIHNEEVYRPVFDLFDLAIKEYIEAIGINKDAYDTYYTRSWGVRQRGNKIVEPHTHAVSHLTAVYYPKIHEGSGDLQVGLPSNPNELFGGLFNTDSYNDGTLNIRNPLCLEEREVKVEEDLLVLFPSKTQHRTTQNTSDESRYSITTDVLLVLRDANRAEHGLPPIEEWRKSTPHE
jgi:hypothetical protein